MIISVMGATGGLMPVRDERIPEGLPMSAGYTPGVFIGTDDGFKAVVGGKGGGTARVAQELVDGLTEDQAVALAKKVIAFYRENGQAPERLRATIDRVGFDKFKNAVL